MSEPPAPCPGLLPALERNPGVRVYLLHLALAHPALGKEPSSPELTPGSHCLAAGRPDPARLTPVPGAQRRRVMLPVRWQCSVALGAIACWALTLLHAGEHLGPGHLSPRWQPGSACPKAASFPGAVPCPVPGLTLRELARSWVPGGGGVRVHCDSVW